MLTIAGLSGRGNGELPADFDLLGLLLAAPIMDPISKLGLGRKILLQALATQGREVEFNLVEPEVTFGHGIGLLLVRDILRAHGFAFRRETPDSGRTACNWGHSVVLN